MPGINRTALSAYVNAIITRSWTRIIRSYSSTKTRPLALLPSTLPVNVRYSSFPFLTTCPTKRICLVTIVNINCRLVLARRSISSFGTLSFQDIFNIRRRNHIPSVAGLHSLADSPSFTAVQRRGQTYHFNSRNRVDVVTLFDCRTRAIFLHVVLAIPIRRFISWSDFVSAVTMLSGSACLK